MLHDLQAGDSTGHPSYCLREEELAWTIYERYLIPIPLDGVIFRTGRPELVEG
jgi:hypothetical protein